MSNYLGEFLPLFLINFMNIISPGACFAVTVRNSAIHSRTAGILTALGIGFSTCIQKIYVILGLGLFVSKHPTVFYVIKYLGCAHLVYMAFGCSKNFFSSYKYKTQLNRENHLDKQKLSKYVAFRSGFLTDALNPQASLGFTSILLATVSLETPITVQLIYAVFLIISAFLWYITVALVFSSQRISNKFNNFKKWFDGVIGILLIFIASRLLKINL